VCACTSPPLNSVECGLRSLKRFEPQHRPRHSFHAAVILLHDILMITQVATYGF
jgi:hypothetical protein